MTPTEQREEIKVGDKVGVTFVRGKSLFRVTVLHVPVATGDSWRLKTDDGTLIYIQLFESMRRL